MNLKENLNRKRKIILIIGIVLLAILLFNRFTSKTSEMRANCETFVRHNGCYLRESEISDFEAGRELQSFAEETKYPSAKAVCGCASPSLFNITDL